jgi:hypothetical protein
MSAARFTHVFGATQQLLLVARAEPAQQEPADKARNKPAAARSLRSCKARRRQRDDRNFHSVFANPASPLCKAQRQGGEPGQREPNCRPDADLLDHDASNVDRRRALDLSSYSQPKQ